MSKKYLIVIAGPTGVGKTNVAMDLAKHYNTEIISADARQFYREMEIGTAKPSVEQLEVVKHHFIDFLSVQDNYDVGQYEKDVLKLLEELFLTHNIIILSGGAGLFIKAVTEGFDKLPEVDTEIRASLQELLINSGIGDLQLKLEDVDPEYYKKVDINNPQRLIRALEVFYATGKPFSSFHKQAATPRTFNVVKICLTRERSLLYQKINARVDKMFDQGLLEEAKKLIPYRDLNALRSVGYSELFEYFDGNIDLDRAKELIKQNTRNYAKRQITWFKKDPEYVWIDADNYDEILRAINDQVK